MARQMADDGQELFRAVVVYTYDYADGRPSHTSVSHFGPHTARNASGGMITREKRREDHWNRFADRRGYTVTVTGHVERAATVWTPVAK